MVGLKVRAAGLLSVAAVALAGAAQAQVVQTDGAMTPLPQPVGMAEVNLITQSWARNTMTQSWKDPMTGAQLTMPIIYGQYYSPPAFPQFVDGDAITLQGLFKWRGEQIDPVANAKTAPGYFSPTCGFSGQLLLMGGNCQVSFGWYNVADPNSTTPPAPGEIYEFIPNDPTYLNCKDENGGAKTDGFCPLAWDTRSPRDLSIHQWTPMAFDSGNIKTDPRYTGGYVAFAVIGNPAKACKETKFSMYNHNVKNTNGQPWVASLIYQSTVDPEGFYMAFEDLPMSPADWRQTGVPGDMATNDGDFNDFVFYVSGINCMGGGQPCTTELQGACSVGRTDCAVGDGTVGMCRPIVTPGAERCDNVDNDCNGIVDDGDGLCTGAGQVCDQGQCVDACGTGEFRCDPGFTCVSGHCIDDLCASITCPMGQACREGVCQEACQGIVCPLGSECQLGRCVDPCKDVTCPAGRVCEKGLCVSDCACRGCQNGMECQADGRCLDPQCVGIECPSGQQCVAGACVDSCPPGQVIVDGQCVGPGTGGSGNGAGADGPLGPLGGALNSGGASNGSGANNGGPGRGVADPGCACEVAGGSRRSDAALLLAGFGLAFWLGRRRSRSAA